MAAFDGAMLENKPHDEKSQKNIQTLPNQPSYKGIYSCRYLSNPISTYIILPAKEIELLVSNQEKPDK
ncbi:MAG: hypothetical protein ACLUSK_09765 [Bacteroides stercoris]